MRRILAPLALLLSACVATPPILLGDPVPPITAPPAQVAVRVLGYSGEPLAGAEVVVALPEGVTEKVESDVRGLAFVTWAPEGIKLDVSGPAHEPTSVSVELFPDGEELEVRLTARVLDGVVRGMAGAPLLGATVTLGEQSVMTGEDGEFQFIAVEPGAELTVARSAYTTTTTTWNDGLVAIDMEPFVVRGLHVGGPDPRNPEKWAQLLDIAETTEVNTLVVDIKDESGQVYYATAVPLAAQVRAVYSTYDAGAVVEDVRSRGIYLIGRIVTFQDPIAASRMPEIAVLDTTTGQPYSKRGQYFLDPTDPIARQYALDLGLEACELGFQEIQFDYIRYPDGFGENTRFDGGSTIEVRQEAIRSFLETAKGMLNPVGCAVSGDIFGFITNTLDDGGIGQQLEQLAAVTDVLSPMVYPSHYSTGWYGFDVPNDNPGPVVRNALEDGLERVADEVILRPWLQDFYYNAAQVRVQIDESERLSVGWMLWNAATDFTIEALLPFDAILESPLPPPDTDDTVGTTSTTGG